MKKYTLYLLLAALTGLFASCSRDENPVQTSENNHVRIGASIDGALRTRAGESLTIPDNYKLRYVLEVYSSDALVCKYEKTATDASSVDFDFELTEAGDYTAVVWADFVEATAKETLVDANGGLKAYTHYADKHYKTTDNLQQVGIITTDYVINDESRDAFCASETITKGVGALTESITLKRPFGQINVIEKNTGLLEKVQSMTLTYKVPASFDVKTGAVTGSAEVNPTVNTSLPTATPARQANLFYDFILAPATGQTTLEAIAMTFTSKDNAVLLNDYTIPANMPVVRNKRTNISGSILHTSDVPSDAASLSVGISNGWEETIEKVEIPDLVWDGTATAEPAGYDATSPGTVNITSAAELAWLSNQSQASSFENYTFNLTTDINLNNHEWTPIGRSGCSFKGTFDGKNYTVSNLKCTNSDYAGLFGSLSGATVKNVTVSGSVSYVSNQYMCNLGGIAGGATSSIISGCTNQCTITAMGGNAVICNVGGIVGSVSIFGSKESKLLGNTNTGIISTNNNPESGAGGIIGRASVMGSTDNITLTNNTYSSGTPDNVCIGYCYISNGGTITIDDNLASNGKPYPVLSN